MDASRAQDGSLCLKDLHLKLRYKRLEKGRFCWPATVDGASIRMRSEELAMLVSGLDLAQAQSRRGWYRREPAA